MKIEREGCDVFHVDDWPRVALDNVRAVHVEVAITLRDENVPVVALKTSKMLCKKARERLLNGIERLLEPPAKREKDSATA